MHPQDMKPVPMYQRAKFLETENERLLQEQEAIANALGLKQEPFRLADHVSALVEHLDMANEERTEFRAENERLRQSIIDHENDCAVLPEDYSVTEYVTHLRRELELEHQANDDLFSVIAEIAALFDMASSEPSICKKTVDAVVRLQQAKKPQFVDTYGCECGTCRTIRKFAAASE